MAQEGINLIQKKLTTLEEVGFSFDHSYDQSLFGSQSSSSNILHVPTMSVHIAVWSANACCWPTTCGGKKLRRPLVFKITH
jgi:hypothetical protein